VILLGVDLGTQSLKVVVCDATTLAVRGADARAYPTHTPRTGWAEQAPADWEAALAPAIAGALAAAGARPEEVAALAIAAQLDGCIAVDASGVALHPALIWHDRRALAYAEAPPDLFSRAPARSPILATSRRSSAGCARPACARRASTSPRATSSHASPVPT